MAVINLKSIKAVGITGCTGKEISTLGIEQVDANAAYTEFPDIYSTVHIFIQPDLIPDPISIREITLLADRAISIEIGHDARIISVENTHKARGSFTDKKFKDPGGKAQACLGTSSDWHVADRNQHGWQV